MTVSMEAKAKMRGVLAFVGSIVMVFVGRFDGERGFCRWICGGLG